MPSASPSLAESATSDPLTGVDTIIIIENGAQNIRIASIPYPFPLASSSTCASASSSIDLHNLASSIPIEIYPNAIARTRSPHVIPSHTSPTGPAPGSKTSIFVSSHIHNLLDDYAALHLRLPHQSGVIVDWAAQKTIWDHVLTTHLANTGGNEKKGKAKLLAGKAVVITEAYLNPEPVQYAIDLMLFEQYGATAVWRTSAANLIGIGTDVFSPSPSNSTLLQDASPQPQPSKEPTTASSPSRSVRPARTTSAEPSLARIISPPRPQSMLILDLGYSYCHVIPIINSQPHLASVRRLELGGKMLINLLKETLSFGQLDMMDESWLISYIFEKVSFVAAEEGKRVYRGREKVQRELEKVRKKDAKEWSYEDLLLLEKYGKRRREKRVGIVWRLPDYGGGASKKAGDGESERARYGYVQEGPGARGEIDGERRKRSKIDDRDSEFIATSTHSAVSKKGEQEQEEKGEQGDPQSLTLTSERYSIIEHLFNPSSLSLDQQPLPELILSSISSLPTSLAGAGDMMWSNIVLSGGLANLVGMKPRLCNELRPLAPADVPVRILPDGGEVDKSLLAIQAGVMWVTEFSAREAVRREKVARGKTGKGKGRKSVIANDGETDGEGGRGEKGRWMTYAQWSNPPVIGGGAPGESDVVKAANKVFYPINSIDATER